VVVATSVNDYVGTVHESRVACENEPTLQILILQDASPAINAAWVCCCLAGIISHKEREYSYISRTTRFSPKADGTIPAT
jgi:hypothetical protein